MQLESTDKIQRVLGIYKKLVSGEIVSKVEEANNYGVNERSIQRDIDDIRSFMESEVGRTGIINNVIYDREKKGFRLEQQNPTELTNGQMLAICKILLDSRALLKTDMIEILNKLIENCVTKNNQKEILDLIKNERFYYIEPRHKVSFLDTMWDIGQAIRKSQYIHIKYEKAGTKEIVERKLKVPTKKEIKQGKKGKEKGTEKNISTTQNKKRTKRFSMEQANSEEIERLKRNYAQNKIESNREAIKRIITKLGDEKITDLTKKKILEYCKEIVKYDGTLTEDEYRILTDVITRDEAIPDMSGIRFVLDVCTQQHNFLPAMKLLNNCIEIYGSLPQLEEARDVISKTHRKQLMINSLEKDGNVEKTMRKFGAQEAEVREIKRVYIDTNKEQSGNKQRDKRMNKKDDGIEM